MKRVQAEEPDGNESPAADPRTVGGQPWREVRTNAGRALRETWGTSRPLTLVLVVSALLGALVPTVLAVLSGVIVSDVERMLGEGESRLDRVLPWLILISVLLLLGGLSEVLRRYARHRLADDMNLRISREVLEHAAKLDLAFFEIPENHNMLARATH